MRPPHDHVTEGDSWHDPSQLRVTAPCSLSYPPTPRDSPADTVCRASTPTSEICPTMHVCMPESRRLGQVKSWQAGRLTLLCCGANPHELRYQCILYYTTLWTFPFGCQSACPAGRSISNALLFAYACLSPRPPCPFLGVDLHQRWVQRLEHRG